MGACCGKGSKVKDPDKSPYSPSTAKTDEPGRSNAKPEEYGNNKQSEQPQVREITAPISSSPPHSKIGANDDNGDIGINKVKATTKRPVEVVFNANRPEELVEEPIPPVLPAKIQSSNTSPVRDVKKSDSSHSAASAESHGEKGKRDSAQTEKILPPKVGKEPALKAEDIVTTNNGLVPPQIDESLDSSIGVDEVDVPQVELHIDESKLGDVSANPPSSPPPPLPPKEKSPLPKKASTSPKRRKGSVEAPTSIPSRQFLAPQSSAKPKGESTENAPDPLSIIENVRNRNKDGYTKWSSETSTTTSSGDSGKVTTTHTVITSSAQAEKQIIHPVELKSPPTNIESSPKLPEKMKNKENKENDSMAILGALKIIRESGGQATLQKEETKTIIQEIATNDIKEDKRDESSFVTEVKVEKSTRIVTASEISTSSSSQSKIPLSPLRKESPEKDEWKSCITTKETKTEASVSPVVPTAVNNNNYTEEKKSALKIETKKESILSTDDHIFPTAVVNGSHPKKTERHISFGETVVSAGSTSSDSDSSLSDTCPLEDGPALIEIKKDAILQLLPNFTPANVSIMARSEICQNTRISTFRVIDQWIEEELPKNEEQPRTMVLKAAPGMGKSSVLKHACSKYGLQLAARHFFCYNSDNLSQNHFKDVVLYIVFQLLEKLEHYIRCLPSMDKIRHILKNGSLEDVLNVFIYEALMNNYELDHDEEMKMLIVLDALDECVAVDRDDLLEFVDTFNQKLPPWMFLLASIRDENRLTSKLNNVFVVEMKNNNENLTDMKRIIKEPLGNFMDRISLDGGLTHLAKKTHGLALCASLYNKMLHNMDKDKKIALREIESKFPTGLNGVLEQTLKKFRQCMDLETDSKQKYSVLLGMLCYAREPIDASVLEAVGIKDTKAVLDSLSVILGKNKEGLYYIYHKLIAEWVFSDIAGEYRVETIPPKSSFARLCMDWLEPSFNDLKSTSPLAQYALKNCVAHLVDVTKQQDNIGKVLCNLKVTEAQMKIHNVDIYDVLKIYDHNHVQIGSEKEVMLSTYLNKFPKVLNSVNSFQTFLLENSLNLKFSPESLNQIAANNSHSERIQQNARVELGNSSWIEDLTLVSQTPHISTRVLQGSICCVDLSPDGKTIAVVTNNGDVFKLMQFNPQTSDEKAPSLDITSLEGRTGVCCKFMPDNLNVFVGSLSHIVNNKGKAVASGMDLASIQSKHKYAVGCCDISQKYLAVSLNTLDFGGRSVYLSILNIKEKKAVKTLEALQFRFGGSSSFGVKSCTISPNEKLIAGCVKDSNKNQLKVNIWAVGKWDMLYSTNIIGENITKCYFTETNSLLLDVKEKGDHNSKCLVWQYQELGEAAMIGLDNSTNSSASHPSKCVCVSWHRNSENAQINTWKKGENISKQTGTKYRIYGVQKTSNLLVSQSSVIFFGERDSSMTVYNMNELQCVDASYTELCDLNVSDMLFMPRSDNSVIVNKNSRNMLTVFNCDSVTNEPTISRNSIPEQELVPTNQTLAQPGKIFKGTSAAKQNCFVSPDGVYLILNLGNGVGVWNSTDDTFVTLRSASSGNQTVSLCMASPKEANVCVVYDENPHTPVFFDLKSKNQVRKFVPEEGSTQKTGVTDLTFMPHGGHLVTYHKNAANRLIIWNQRTGKQVSTDSRKMSFGRASSSLDRLVINYHDPDSNGNQLILRNSDNKFSTALNPPDEWSLRSGHLDVDFSPDGTILIGVETRDSACRVWNAANGEVLKDLDVKFKDIPCIVGMPTNTHVLLFDERIQVIDIASGEVICIAPLSSAQVDGGTTRFEIEQMSISPRGNIIEGYTIDGRVLMWKCHNFTAIKRKTTLQRIKSFS